MSGRPPAGDAAVTAGREAIAWHDVECGAYAADLETWRRLAERAGGPVVELGCGTGRVALDLAARGHEVTAVEVDPELGAEARRRAEERGLAMEVEVADALEAGAGEFGLAAAPMQLVQAIAPAERPLLLAAVRSRLRDGGFAALALVDDRSLGGLDEGEEAPPVVPDVREIDGWVYSSRPLWVSVDADAITVTRVREAVSPGGELHRSAHRDILARLTASQLEREAARHNLRSLERIELPGAAEVDSSIVVLEAR